MYCIVVLFFFHFSHGLWTSGSGIKLYTNERHNKSIFNLLSFSAVSSNSILNDDEKIILQPKLFLKTLLSSRSSALEKEKMILLYENVCKDMKSKIEFIDLLINEVESVKSNKWATFPWIVPFPSYRVKLGIMLRLIDYFTSESDPKIGMILNSNNSLDINQQNMANKRKAVGVLINQLKVSKSIRKIESEAFRRTSRNTMEEMLERTPQGLETPSYKVVDHRKTWEVRSYDSFAVCSTFMNPNSPGPGSFNALAGYIFGKNSAQEKMAMTTPVLTAIGNEINGNEANNINGVKMSFVMPSKYWMKSDNSSALEKVSPPKPVINEVFIEPNSDDFLRGSESVAVVWFGGFATKTEVDKRTNQLLRLVGLDTQWEVKKELINGNWIESKPFLMQYNDPFQPPWKRRNEVAVPVIKKQS
eukprot:gene11309-15170_t